MDIVNNIYLQWGAVGLIIIGLVWFSRQLFVYFMKQYQSLLEENRALEKEFRSFHMENTSKHLMIIERNTEAFEKLIYVIDKIAEK